MTAEVRAATAADTRSLAEVHHETVTSAYKSFFPPDSAPPSIESLVAEWEADFLDPTFGAFVLEETGSHKMIGTVAARADPDHPGCGQLRRLHVLPGRWGCGLGSALHDAALDKIRRDGFRRAGLWVLEANARARHFYQHRGWELVAGETLEIHGAGSVEVRYEIAVE